MGIRAAAFALQLDFVPIAEERYDLIVPEDYLADLRVTAALDIIQTNKDFRDRILSLGGYNLRESGSVLYRQ
jgi:putative molybdopterin biosynthesis protein